MDLTSGSMFLRPTLSKLRKSLLGWRQDHHASQKLNHDILLDVMRYLELRDVFNMMFTCRALYELGLSVFLKEIVVTGTPGMGMPRFHLYRRHLLQNPARFSKVLSLTSTYKALDDGTLRPEGHNVFSKYQPFPPQFRFTDLLQHLCNLEVLDVTMEGANVGSSFCDWIRTLKRLGVLKLREVGPHVQPIHELLRDLPSKVKVMHVVRCRYGLQQGTFDPISSLQHASGSLESLVIESYDWHNGPRIPQQPAACLPAVHNLGWISCWAVHTDLLTQTFPKLRSLRVGLVKLDTPGVSGVEGVPDHVRLQMRERNVDAQLAPVVKWDRLERLEGSLLSLWILGLRCHVERIETALRAWGKANIGHLVVLLHDTSPKHLTLTTYTEHLFDLDRVFNFPALESFELHVDVIDKHNVMSRRGTLQADVRLTLTRVLGQVYQSRIRRLTIVVRTLMATFKSPAYSRACRRGDFELKRPPPTQHLDAKWRAFVDTVFDALPLLEELTLEVWGYQTLVCMREGVARRELTGTPSPWDPMCMSREGIWLDLFHRLELTKTAAGS